MAKHEKDDSITIKANDKSSFVAAESIEPMGFKTNGLHNQKQSDLMKGNVGFERKASTSGEMTVFSDNTNVARTPLLYLHPTLDPIYFIFPRERIDDANRIYRHYYCTNNLIGNIIDLHSEFPLSDFTLQVQDKSIEKYFNDFKDRLNLVSLYKYILKSYWLFGESFFYGNWDVNNFEWKDFVDLPPENIDIVGSYVNPDNLYFLKADPNLLNILKSTKLSEKDLANYWDLDYVKSLQDQKPFPLKNERLIILQNKVRKGDLRGESLVKRVAKDLMYQDKVRYLQLTFVDRHMFPIKLFKLGSREHGWIPGKRHFQKFKTLLAQAANDPDFSIIYHFGVEVDYIGTKDKIANLIPEFDFTDKRIMAGMFANDALVYGESTTYAQSTVSMKILMHKYLGVRELLEKESLIKMFLPIAKERGFIKRSKAELDHKIIVNSKSEDIRVEKMFNFNGKQVLGSMVNGNFRVSNKIHVNADLSKYYMPTVIWQKLNLLNNTSEQEFVRKLYDANSVPFKFVCDIFGWDHEYIQKALKTEYHTTFDPVYRKAREDVSSDKNNAVHVLKGKPFDELIDMMEVKEKERKEIEKTDLQKQKKQNVTLTKEEPIKKEIQLTNIVPEEGKEEPGKALGETEIM